MNTELQDFLAAGTRLSEQSANWGGNMPLQITSYLCHEIPPLEYVSSVRAIVFREESALVITEENGHMYILPGGRVERGEAPLETLKRELLEETGWSLREAEPLGCLHFHHLAPAPENYPYPYPDFIWLIYLAEAEGFTSETIIHDDYVSKSEFKPIKETIKIVLEHEKGTLPLLEAALKRR